MNEEWIFVETVSAMGQGYNLYENKDHTKCKQIWFDGEEEIYDTCVKAHEEIPDEKKDA